MNWMDAVIGVLMLLGFIHGLVKGAIQEISVALALVIGVIVAGRVTAGADDLANSLSHPTLMKIFIFALTFVVVAILIGLAGRAVSGLAKVANLRTIDRIIGGVVGACLVGIAIGIVLAMIQMVGGGIPGVRESFLAPQLLATVSYLGRFLPRASEATRAALLTT
jgi:membrane protein required for colicin V production